MNGYHNKELKKMIHDAGFTICEVGYHAGISEPTIFRWLRYPLDSNKKQILIQTLDKLKTDGGIE